MSEYFSGYYYKHQNNNDTLCLIVGKSKSEEFIQIITNDHSYNVPFIGNNKFSEKGLIIDIKTQQLTLKGKISYENLSPIKYDIMGPFKYFPMECKHGIVSMHHKLSGQVVLNNKTIDFTGGNGYIEKDSGTSFPKSYVWVQANDFIPKCSIMASSAHIPFCKFSFEGCICIVQYNGKEYRMATYLGAYTKLSTENMLILKQGKYRLEIVITNENSHKLKAPNKGDMKRTIKETASCPGNFKFYIKNKLIFDLNTQNASYEYEQNKKISKADID